MLKINRLMFAMAQHEGWFPIGSGTHPEGSRSYRNHNPGNLRQSPLQIGTVDGFAAFDSDVDGWAALRWDIYMKAVGKTSTGLSGESSIKDLIDIWAPSADGNDPMDYLSDVVTISGLSPDTKLQELFTE